MIDYKLLLKTCREFFENVEMRDAYIVEEPKAKMSCKAKQTKTLQLI